MKTIEVDEELYRYIVSQTEEIGESASAILRRLLKLPAELSGAERPEIKRADNNINNNIDNNIDNKVSNQTNHKKETVAAKSAKQADNALGNEGQKRKNKIIHLLESEKYKQQSRIVSRFILVLSTLYSLDSERFSIATESLRGRTRAYFANDEETLLNHGKQSKPKVVTGTPYWVITNTNTERKRSMIRYLMAEMQFSNEVIETVCAAL